MVYTWAREWYGDRFWTNNAKRNGIDWSITMVNRQIRSETFPILYGKSTFRLWWHPHGRVSNAAEDVERAKERCELVRTLTIEAGAIYNLHRVMPGDIQDGLNRLNLFLGLRKLVIDGNDRCCSKCYHHTQILLKMLASWVKKMPNLEEVVMQGTYDNEELVNDVHAQLERAKIYRMLEGPIYIG